MRMNTTALLLSMVLAACAEGAQLGPSAGDVGHGATGTDDGAGGVGGAGEMGGGDAGGGCEAGATRGCYTGAEGTRGVGACAPGTQRCEDDGSGFGPCEGEVTPGPESCVTEADDNCNGEINEECVCAPGNTLPCYSGPAGTEGVGACHPGAQACAADGFSWGPCEGEGLPAPQEDLNTPVDDDCTGTPHDSICELHGIILCASGLCLPVITCGSSGGPLICTTEWECIGG